jgi:hypothetical protein
MLQKLGTYIAEALGGEARARDATDPRIRPDSECLATTSLDETQFAQSPDAVGSRPCPRCRMVMEFRHMLGRFGDRPPLQVFLCEACGATDFVPA